MKRTAAIIPTEDQECLLFVEWLEIQKKQRKVVLFTHVSNENNMRMGIRVAMHKKRLGLRKGFPDYIVVTPKQIFFIEMKRSRGGIVSLEQKEWVEALNKIGLAAKVCLGFEDAVNFIEDDDFEGE